MLDKSRKPSRKEIADHIGVAANRAWDEIVSFLEVNYDFCPEIDFGGSKYGWSIRYRKRERSLCTLFPEKNAFAILIVLGKREAEVVQQSIGDFSQYTQEIFKAARQYHDGRWLLIRVKKRSDTTDIKRLLLIKRKPNKVSS